MILPTIIKGADLPTGQSAFQRTYHALHAIQTLFLPYISDMAAIRNGAKAIPRKYDERVICVVDALILSSREMSPKAAAIILADMMGISCPKEKMTPIVTLRCEGQL
jgi:hypothetical protein